MSAPIGRKPIEAQFQSERTAAPKEKSTHGMVPHTQLFNSKAPLDFEASKTFRDPSTAKVNNLVRRYGI